jgi:hypothetical protein
MTKENKSLLDKLVNLPRELIYCLLLIVFIVPMLVPFSLPVPVSAETRRWYGIIENLPPGSVIMYDSAYTGGGEPEVGPMAVAVITHIMTRPGLRLISMATLVDGVLLWERAIAEVNPEQYGKKYGQDYVMLGFISGVETAEAAVGRNIRATTSTDYKGVPLDQLPAMKGVNEAKDFALLICISDFAISVEGWIKQWVTPYKIPFLTSPIAGMVPTLTPYRSAGQVQAVIAGAQSGEYEFLIGKPGRGIRSANVMSSTHLFVVALVIIGNLPFLLHRKLGGK